MPQVAETWKEKIVRVFFFMISLSVFIQATPPLFKARCFTWPWLGWLLLQSAAGGILYTVLIQPPGWMR
jgi:hypothetical protein